MTGLSGRLTTFNFLDATGSSHLQNQRYTQCIRRELGYCCVRYGVCTDSNSFSIDQTIAAPGTAQTDTECSLDYINILGEDFERAAFPGFRRRGGKIDKSLKKCRK